MVLKLSSQLVSSSDDELDSTGLMIKSNQGNHNAGLDTLNDLDGEESALHEFDFLTGDTAATSTNNIQQSKSNGNSHRLTAARKILSKRGTSFPIENNSSEWDIDQSRLNRLKEEYKRERLAKPHQSTITTSVRTNQFDNGNAENSSNQRAFSDNEHSMSFPSHAPRPFSDRLLSSEP